MIRQMRLVAIVPTAGTGVTADTETIHGKILKISFVSEVMRKHMF